MVWKSLLVLYAKDVLTDLVSIHHGQPRWQYCTQVSSTLFGEAVARLFLASKPSMTRRDISKEVYIRYYIIYGEMSLKGDIDNHLIIFELAPL